MKIYAPDYYKDFRCLAGNCRHSCCIGWEVDIDSDTLEYYKTVGGEIGERLKNAVSYEGDTAHFKMCRDEKCPFLNEKGLCDIMSNLGMDKVSYICDEHPRFYNFYSDRQEIGLGLSCEAVADLIVNKQEKTLFVTVEDGEELLWEDECDFLDLRDEVFDILQNRDKSVESRIRDMLEYRMVKLPRKTLSQWADVYLGLERLDENWTELLNDVKTVESEPINEDWFETAVEQLAVYFAYRHMTDGFDRDNISGRLGFVAVSCGFIGALCRMENSRKTTFTQRDMAEICRMYSAEIEYSDENTARLMAIFNGQ